MCWKVINLKSTLKLHAYEKFHFVKHHRSIAHQYKPLSSHWRVVGTHPHLFLAISDREWAATSGSKHVFLHIPGDRCKQQKLLATCSDLNWKKDQIDCFLATNEHFRFDIKMGIRLIWPLTAFESSWWCVIPSFTRTSYGTSYKSHFGGNQQLLFPWSYKKMK